MANTLGTVGVASGICLLRKFAPQHTGITLNEWQYPVKRFSLVDVMLESKLKELKSVIKLDIPHRIWYAVGAVGVVSGIYFLWKFTPHNTGTKFNECQYPVKKVSWPDGRYVIILMELMFVCLMELPVMFVRKLAIPRRFWYTLGLGVVSYIIYLVWECTSLSIGIDLNEWQYPVKAFSCADGKLESKLKELKCVGELDIPYTIWNEAAALVNEILELLLCEMRAQAQTLKYEGLILDGYRKQGSSREGLKIRTADEFDVLLEYHIEGLRIESVPIVDYGIPRPGLGKMKVLNPDYQIETQFTTWLRKEAIIKNQGSYFLNARILHQSVFESIIDRCRQKITNKTKQNISFQLNRSMNAPSVTLTIKIIQREKGIVRSFWDWLCTNQDLPDVINIDVVPALIINMENAMGYWTFMKCPRYAVVKWMEESQPSASQFKDPSMTWRMCTSGYEKHYMDLARTDTEKRYIMTACRIVKVLMNKEKEKRPPLPISTFLRSFYLKNIALYCMLFTKSVEGVYQALGYFFGFLKISLDHERLPQFFQGNCQLRNDFPACADGGQVNLFANVSRDTLSNARHSFNTLLIQLFEMYDNEAFKSIACHQFQKFITVLQ